MSIPIEAYFYTPIEAYFYTCQDARIAINALPGHSGCHR